MAERVKAGSITSVVEKKGGAAPAKAPAQTKPAEASKPQVKAPEKPAAPKEEKKVVAPPKKET